MSSLLSRRQFLQSTAATTVTSTAAAAAVFGSAEVLTAAPSRYVQSPKKGCCFAARPNNRWLEFTKSLDPNWLYTWNLDQPEGLPEDIEFCPMFWGGGKDEKFRGKVEQLRPLIQQGKVKQVLGFNEPDKRDQSNMTVARALELWPLLMELDVLLVSPSCAHPDREWMLEFMEGVKKQKLRVDFVGVHSYGGPNARALMTRMQKVARLFGRPIWITEFAVADWKAKTLEQNRFSAGQIAKFMRDVIPALNASPFIARYAWFSGQPKHKALGNSALFDNRGELTPLGRLYSQA